MMLVIVCSSCGSDNVKLVKVNGEAMVQCNNGKCTDYEGVTPLYLLSEQNVKTR
jgi:hypothetical protein